METTNQSLSKLHSITRFLRKSGRFYFQNYNLNLFLKFLKSDPEVSSIINSLQQKYTWPAQELDEKDKHWFKRDHLISLREKIGSFEEYVAFCVYYLERAVMIRGSDVVDNFLYDKTNTPEGFEKDKKRFVDDCIEPIIIYIELQIKHAVNAIYVLGRYKVLCELYDRERLMKLGEVDITKQHVSRFLFDSGFTYALSETIVESGRIDNFAFNLGKTTQELSNLPNAIIAEGKIYKDKKQAFTDVFAQTHKRVMELNFEEGYCIVFNKSNENIVLQNTDGNINGIYYKIVKNSKIFFLTVNIHDDFYTSKKSLTETKIDTNNFINR